MWMAHACGLKRADNRERASFIVRSTMSNSGAPSRHRRNPGNDDAELHSRDAICIRVFFHAFQESLPRTDGRPSLSGGQVFAPRCLCFPKREAERRTAHHSCRASMRRRGRGPISGAARLSALLRGHAPGFHSRLGPGRASWNRRMQAGGPSPAPVQRAPRSPARAGRADTQTA
jgi:hypothetical protein